MDKENVATTGIYPPPLPPDNLKRMKTIHYYRLECVVHDELCKVVELAEHLFNMPYILINLVKDDEIQPLETINYSKEPFDRDTSFCGYAVLSTTKSLVVNDTFNDERFRLNPYTTGPLKIRFYVGSPITLKSPPKTQEEATMQSTQEFSIGTVCMLDTRPRDFTEQQVQQLEHLAEVVRDILQKSLYKLQLVDHTQMSMALVEFIQETPNSDTLPLAKSKLQQAMQTQTVYVEKWDPKDTFTFTIGDVTKELPVKSGQHLWDAPDYTASAIIHTLNLGEDDHYIIVVYTDNPTQWFDLYDSSFVLHFTRAIASVLQEDLVRQANSLKTQFIELVSHELRTPLHGILSSAELLEEEQITPAQHGVINMISTSGKNLLNVINGLLDFNKWEQDNVKVLAEATNVLDILQEVADALMVNLSPDAEIILDPQLDSQRPFVFTDPSLLRQILINLVSNAVKFTSYGHVIISVTLSNDTMIWQVKDTGQGISEDFVRNGLFTPFKKENPHSQGVGLGLVISRRLAKALNGTLLVKETQVGIGTTIELALPVKIDESKSNVLYKSSTLWTLLGASHTITTNNVIDIFTRHTIQNVPPQQGVKRILLYDYENTPDDVIEEQVDTDHYKVILCRPDVQTLIPNRIVNSNGVFTLTKPVGVNKLVEFMKNLERRVQRQPVDSGQVKILIVDDNSFNRNMLAMYCKKRSIQYDTAVDGMDAYEKFKEGDFNVILMDVQMPRCDGPEAVKMIREYELTRQETRSSCVIIMLTGLSTDESKERSYKMGCDGYYVKPVSLRILDQLIKGKE